MFHPISLSLNTVGSRKTVFLKLHFPFLVPFGNLVLLGLKGRYCKCRERKLWKDKKTSRRLIRSRKHMDGTDWYPGCQLLDPRQMGSSPPCKCLCLASNHTAQQPDSNSERQRRYFFPGIYCSLDVICTENLD